MGRRHERYCKWLRNLTESPSKKFGIHNELIPASRLNRSQIMARGIWAAVVADRLGFDRETALDARTCIGGPQCLCQASPRKYARYAANNAPK